MATRTTLHSGGNPSLPPSSPKEVPPRPLGPRKAVVHPGSLMRLMLTRPFNSLMRLMRLDPIAVTLDAGLDLAP